MAAGFSLRSSSSGAVIVILRLDRRIYACHCEGVKRPKQSHGIASSRPETSVPGLAMTQSSLNINLFNVMEGAA